MAKFIKIEPLRELCKHCREWVDGKDVDWNDIPHCVRESKFESQQYMMGMSDNCTYYNEW